MAEALRAARKSAAAEKLLCRGFLHYIFDGNKTEDRKKAFKLIVEAGKLAELTGAPLALLYYNRAAEVSELYYVGERNERYRLYFRIAELSFETGANWSIPAQMAEKAALELPDYSNAGKICEWTGEDSALERAVKYYRIGGHLVSVKNCLEARAVLAVNRGEFLAARDFFAEASDSMIHPLGRMYICEQVLCCLALGDTVAARKQVSAGNYEKTIKAFENGDYEELLESLKWGTTASMRERDHMQQLLSAVESRMLDSDDVL
jgi:hypothetical protein